MILSFKLILIGIFFWIFFRIARYITQYYLVEFHSIYVYGYEIIGSILILIGILIIHRVYPFPYSSIAILINIFILLLNITDFFLYKIRLYQKFQLYVPIAMSLILFFVAKLMESGTRYFGNFDLAKKWEYMSIITFFGFSIPFYTYVSLIVCDFISYDGLQFTLKFLLLFIPLSITLLSLFLYYIHTLIKSFRFLLKVKENK